MNLQPMSLREKYDYAKTNILGKRYWYDEAAKITGLTSVTIRKALKEFKVTDNSKLIYSCVYEMAKQHQEQ